MVVPRVFFSIPIALGLGITYLAFNLVVVAPDLWAKTVFHIQILLLDAFLEDERRCWVMDIFSRGYFVLHLFSVACLMTVTERVWKKYVATSGECWWQFRLTGIFTITTGVCLLIVLVLLLFAK
jgi:hypothetical protein